MVAVVAYAVVCEGYVVEAHVSALGALAVAVVAVFFADLASFKGTFSGVFGFRAGHFNSHLLQSG